jgi:hypothetical protein
MKKNLILLCIIIVYASCEQEVIQSNIEYFDCNTQDSITSDIKFFPVELYENYSIIGNPKLNLYFKTTEIFPCINYNIAISEFVNNNELKLRFDSIIQYDICLTAPGPATSIIELPLNTNSLILLNGESIDKYYIDITEEKVIINPKDNSFSNLTYNILFRYPKNSFNYQCDIDTSEIQIYLDFLKILNDSLSLVEFNFSGEGRIPYGKDYIDRNRQCLNKYYKYESNAEFDRAGELLRNFVLENNINNNSSAYISLISWNNKKFLSWMMTD